MSSLHLPDSLQDAKFDVACIHIVHADAMNVLKIPNLNCVISKRNGQVNCGWSVHNLSMKKSFTKTIKVRWINHDNP